MIPLFLFFFFILVLPIGKCCFLALSLGSVRPHWEVTMLGQKGALGVILALQLHKDLNAGRLYVFIGLFPCDLLR